MTWHRKVIYRLMVSNQAERSALRDSIRHTHECASRWVKFVRVVETFRGETVWDGQVEVFDLIGHPTADRAYAWAHEPDAGGPRYVAVLHEGSVDSPQTAVRAAVVAEYREGNDG